MTTPASLSADRLLHERDFSLVLGGPIFQLLRRSHLTGDALELVYKRIIAISLFCWLPLQALSALEGKVRGGIAVPFLLDVEAHVWSLVVTPLLIAAELVAHQRMRFVVQQFLERDLIRERDMALFDAAIKSVYRLRNSVLAEVLLFAFVYVVGVLVIRRHYLALETARWYARCSPDRSEIASTISAPSCPISFWRSSFSSSF